MSTFLSKARNEQFHLISQLKIIFTYLEIFFNLERIERTERHLQLFRDPFFCYYLIHSIMLIDYSVAVFNTKCILNISFSGFAICALRHVQFDYVVISNLIREKDQPIMGIFPSFELTILQSFLLLQDVWSKQCRTLILFSVGSWNVRWQYSSKNIRYLVAHYCLSKVNLTFFTIIKI